MLLAYERHHWHHVNVLNGNVRHGNIRQGYVHHGYIRQGYVRHERCKKARKDYVRLVKVCNVNITFVTELVLSLSHMQEVTFYFVFESLFTYHPFKKCCIECKPRDKKKKN